MNPNGYGKKLLAVLGGTLLGACASAQTVAVHIMAQETIPPKWITYRDHAEGICPDIINALERVEPRLRFWGYARGRSLPTIEAGLGSGEVDAACGLVASPQRRRVARTVGKPLFPIRHRLAGRADDPAVVDSIDDLVRLGALVNTGRGSPFGQQLARAGVPVDDSTGDNQVNLRKILAGHGRFTYMNELTLMRYIHANGWQDKIRVLPVLKEEPAYFWVSRKADPEAVSLIDGALARIRASGELDRIYARWSRLP